MNNYRITDHAKNEMLRRDISQEIVEQVLDNPEQIVNSYGDRKAYQSRIEMTGKLYLIRVIVEIDDPKVIITVYRTSKIEKYWEESNEGNI